MPIAVSASTTEFKSPPAPKVSVLVPAYNPGRALREAVNSVLAQTLTSFEVIVADDGSSDDAVAWAEAQAAADPRIRVLRAAENRGAAAARNRALAEARGEWLALLDADDRFAPDRLARLVARGEAQQADIVVDNLRLVGAEGDARGRALSPGDSLFSAPLSPAAFVRRNLFLTPDFKLGYLKPMIRHAFVTGHGLRQDEGLRIGEDFHFLLDALLAGGRCVAEPEAGYFYRMTPGSLSRRLSLADLQALSGANRALLARPEVQAEPALRRVLRQRQWSVDRNVEFTRFVEAVKGRRLRDAGGIFARHPDLTPFLAFYGLQSLRKRLPGGRHFV